MSRYLSLLGALLAAANLKADIIYVDASASDGGDGSSWHTPYAKLQDALMASSHGDEIWVAKGVYYPDEGGGEVDNDVLASFVIPEGVSLFGSFVKGQTVIGTRNFEVNQTILSGDIEQNDLDSDGDSIVEHVLDIQGDNTRQVLNPVAGFSLDGFVVNAGDGGTTHPGGGLITESSQVLMVNCIFKANRGSHGGGMNAGSSSGIVRECSFVNNVGAFRAGGILLYSGQGLKVVNCDFEGNVTTGDGGGLNINGGDVSGCRFFGNSAQNGSAIHAFQGVPMVQNCVFFHNRATISGTLFLDSVHSGSVVGSCTFSGNRADALGGAIYANPTGSTSITHCLVWDDFSGESPDGVDIYVEGEEVPGFSHCLIEGWSPVGTGNLDGTLDSNAPLFVQHALIDSGNSSLVDLRLRQNSPGINQGAEDELPLDKLDRDGDGNIAEPVPVAAGGGPRILFSIPDIGAYEASSSILRVKAGAAPGGDGATWGSAIDYLAAALDVAEEGQDIWVGEGVYLPTLGNPNARGSLDQTASFDFKSGVGVYGGFEGGEVHLYDRKPGGNRTILSGDLDGDDRGRILPSYTLAQGANSFHVVRFKDTDATAILDGFVVTGGQAGENEAGTLNNQGGGILIEDADAGIRNCVVTGNSALHGTGGGINCLGVSHPTFTNCLFRGNGASLGSAATIVGSSDAVFVNCTATQNTTTQDPATTGAFFSLGGGIEMENCIVWGNIATNASGAIESMAYLSTKGEIRNSLIEHCKGSGANWNPDIGIDGGGNLDADPSFVGGDDFRLRYSSPAIDTGNSSADVDGEGDGTAIVTSVISLDLSDSPRLANGNSNTPRIIDMGSFEYQGLSSTDIDDDGLSDLFEVENTQPESATSLDAGADLDGDCLSNLEEFVFGQDPHVWGQAIQPKTVVLGNKRLFAVEYPYDESSSQFVDLEIEWSADLEEWFPFDGPVLSLPVGELERFQILSSQAMLNHGKSFVRFRVKKK